MENYPISSGNPLLAIFKGFIQVIKLPHGTIHHISIRVSFGVYTSYKSPQPHGTINHISIRASFRVYASFKIPRPYGTIRHISTRVSFRVYIIPKSPQSEKREKADMHEVCKGFTFPTDFFRKFDMEHGYPKKYQSQKTLRLRSEMSLLKT